MEYTHREIVGMINHEQIVVLEFDLTKILEPKEYFETIILN